MPTQITIKYSLLIFFLPLWQSLVFICYIIMYIYAVCACMHSSADHFSALHQMCLLCPTVLRFITLLCFFGNLLLTIPTPPRRKIHSDSLLWVCNTHSVSMLREGQYTHLCCVTWCQSQSILQVSLSKNNATMSACCISDIYILIYKKIIFYSPLG